MEMRLSRSIVGEKEAEAAARVIREDGYLGMGEATRQFEAEIAQYLGVEPSQAISVNSGTAAVHLAAEAVRVLAEDQGRLNGGQPEILVPTLTFVATFQAVSAAGCKPVPCDVLLESGTIDLEDAAKRVSQQTIALMRVDYASNPWQIDESIAFAKERGLRFIDDAAHAFGCEHRGKKIGSFGDISCFSFDGIKNITCGEGGMAIALDPDTAEIIANSRLLGVEGDTQKRFAGARTWDPDVRRQGWRYHLSNIMAAIGRVQLGRLENEFIPARRTLWDRYKELLSECPSLALFKTDPEDFIVPHIMPVRILDGKKDAAKEALSQAGIPTGTHYKPNHLLSFYGGGKERLPNAERLFKELLTLPLHPGLSLSDVEMICDKLTSFLEKK